MNIDEYKYLVSFFLKQYFFWTAERALLLNDIHKEIFIVKHPIMLTYVTNIILIINTSIKY